ncbi:MAG: hypothetical protein GKR88_05250 [Flavobacteriaceae bacterium]|nr:MAG: hypothetical protein GKR88_05250 [Flavobacteriaceae bacterium]
MNDSSVAIFVLIIIFGSIFGIFYLFFSTRNKERLALIEKGVDAGIFSRAKEKNPAPFWKVFILNLSVLLMGVGTGVLLAMILESALHIDEDALYAGLIFLMAGVGLFAGFTLTKKLDKE